MAIYHLSAKPVQRSAGKSAVAAAAYRSRSTLHDERQRMTFSYTAASDLVHAEIVGFDGDRGSLWNMAEATEKRKDATTAREYEVALPRELDAPDQIELLRDFSTWLNKKYGCVVDFALHSGEGEDEEAKNPHGHVLTTTRSVDADGTMCDVKIPREWSDKKRKEHNLPGRKVELHTVREQWSMMSNAALEKAGIDACLDHRSYAEQGIDRLPTSHLGPAASAMERDGIQTRAGNHNRTVVGIDLERQFDLDEIRDREIQAENLAQRLNDIDAEINAIRNEPVQAPSATGVLEIAPICPTVADQAQKKASKFDTGMALSFAERFKARLFLRTWNVDLAQSILESLRWVDVDARALTLKTGEQITDKGNSVSLSKGSDEAIFAAIAIAKGKGWETVKVTGSDDFQIRAALALKDSGIEPKLTSEIAVSLFSDELQRRDPPTFTPEIDIDALKSRIRATINQTPLREIRTIEEDPRRLEKWISARWGELTKTSEPEQLLEVFRVACEEHAYLAGYSVSSIQSSGIDGKLSKSMTGYKPRKSASQESPNQKPQSSIALPQECHPRLGQMPQEL